MLQTITDVDGMAALRPDWPGLVRPAGNPLMNYDWFVACARAFAPPGALAVLSESGRDGVRAIAPLVRSTINAVPTLELIGSAALGEPGGLPHRSREDLQKLLRGMVGHSPVLLRRLPADAPEARTLRHLSSARALVFERPAGSFAWLPTRGRWSEYVETLSKARRADLRRKSRKAEALGAVRFEMVAPAPGATRGPLERAFAVEAAGWKAAAHTGVKQNPAQWRFFHDLGARAATAGTLRIFFMYIGDTPVAALVGLVSGSAFWALKMGYDAQFKRCSPGALLTQHTIRYCFEQDIERYEFCGWSEPWQYSWTHKLRACVSFWIFPYSRSGMRGLVAELSRLGFRAVEKMREAAQISRASTSGTAGR